jgi:hypothetical protein
VLPVPVIFHSGPAGDYNLRLDNPYGAYKLAEDMVSVPSGKRLLGVLAETKIHKRPKEAFSTVNLSDCKAFQGAIHAERVTLITVDPVLAPFATCCRPVDYPPMEFVSNVWEEPYFFIIGMGAHMEYGAAADPLYLMK